MTKLLTHRDYPAKPFRYFLLSLSAVASLAIAAPAAAQVPVPSGYTYVDSAGRLVAVDRSVSRTPYGYTGVVTAQTDLGYGGTRTFSGQRLAPGQYSYDSRFVGNRGATSQSSGAISCDRAGQCFRNGQYVGPRGGVTTTDARNSVGPNGAFSGYAQTVGPRGQVYTRDAQSARTPYRRTGNTVRTGRNGTSVREFKRTRRPGGYTETSTYTGPRGRILDRRADVDCRGGACARTVTRIGPDGRATRWTGDGRRVAPGVWEGSRTFADRRGRERTRDWRWERKRR